MDQQREDLSHRALVRTCAYFRDNTGGTSVQYDGMTTVLTASTQVCPCEVYHIKLAVQDFCDGGL
jgi:hypothetical protein